MNPLSRLQRLSLYATGAVLVATGVAWAWLHYFVDERIAVPTNAWLMKIHGAAAMLALVLLGSLLFQHVGAGWQAARNRWTGITMLSLAALLIVTGYLLYYAGGEVLREGASVLHLGIGIALPLALFAHRLR